MTIWLPALVKGDRTPLYLAIARAMIQDIANGKLQHGSQLPPQRDLARALGVTVGTISRAYQEVAREGLVTGEVGRGTFVSNQQTTPRSAPGRRFDEPRAPGAPALSAAAGTTSASGWDEWRSPFSIGALPREWRSAPAGDDSLEATTVGGPSAPRLTQDTIDLSVNAPDVGRIAPILFQVLETIRWANGLEHALRYQPYRGSSPLRSAGVDWLRYLGLDAPADEIVVTCGGQHAMLVALSFLCRPGDVVLCESLTYPGIKGVCRMLDLRLEGVDLDEDGLVPEKLEEACRKTGARVLYAIPTLQNPTATVMSEERRHRIVEIARARSLSIVEDDIYGYLVADPPPPLASLAPERTYYVTSVSKSVAPGLRIGFLRAPEHTIEPLACSVMASTMMTPAIAGLLVTVLTESGGIDEILKIQRAASVLHHQMTQTTLGSYLGDHARRESMHAWIELPAPWRAQEFALQAMGRGVLVAPSEAFVVGQRWAPQAVRISPGAVASPQQLQIGLDRLAALLAEAPAPAYTRP